MELVNFLASLWGICIVVITLAMLVKEKHLKKIYASVEAEESLFAYGIVYLAIGVSMVLSYNVWAMQWQVIVTILGWASLIKGLVLLFLPDVLKKCTKKIESFQYLSYALVATLIIGLILTYLGFTAV